MTKRTHQSTNFIAIILGIALLIGCNSTKDSHYVLKLTGSESMNETFASLKTEFEKLQDSITVVINGGGSLSGLNAIVTQKADIGLSSFQFDLDQIFGHDHGIVERVVAYDAIVLINHEDNPIRQLTNEQILGIFSGQYTNWGEIGGREGPILPIIRDQNSGTQKFFSDFFGIETVGPNVFVAKENTEIVNEILGNENGIGYVGLSYFSVGVNDINIPSYVHDHTEFVEPNNRTINSGSYPLKRSLRIYFPESDNPAVNAFLKYLDSSTAQSVIERHGLIPINAGSIQSKGEQMISAISN